MAKAVVIQEIKNSLTTELLSLIEPFIRKEIDEELALENKVTFTEMVLNGCTIASSIKPFGKIDADNDLLVLNKGNRIITLFSSEMDPEDDAGDLYYLLETSDGKVFFVKLGRKMIELVDTLPSLVIQRFAKFLLWCWGKDRLLRYVDNLREYPG